MNKVTVWPIRNAVMLPRKFLKKHSLEFTDLISITIGEKEEKYVVFPKFAKDSVLVSAPKFKNKKIGFLSKEGKVIAARKGIYYYAKLADALTLPEGVCAMREGVARALELKDGDEILFKVGKATLKLSVSTAWHKNEKYGEALSEAYKKKGVYLPLHIWKEFFIKNKIKEGAEVEFQKKLPKGIDELYDDAAQLLQRKEFDAAIEILDQILKINPRYLKAIKGRGMAFLQKSDLKNALASFNSALEINDNDADLWTMKGDILFKQGEYNEATRCFVRAVTLDSKNALAWYLQALCHIKNNRPTAAAKCFESAVYYKPNYPEAWAEKGKVEFNLIERMTVPKDVERQKEDAFISLSKAVELGNEDPVVFYYIAKLLLGAGRRKDAKETIRRAIEIGERNKIPQDEIDLMKTFLKQIEAMRPRIIFEAQGGGEQRRDHYSIGVEFMKAKRFSEAIFAFTQAIENDQNKTEALYGICDANLELADRANIAGNELERGVCLQTAEHTVINLMFALGAQNIAVLLQFAKVYAYAGRKKNADEYVKKAIAELIKQKWGTTYKAKIYHTIAQIYNRLGETRDALRYCTEALKNAPGNAEIEGLRDALKEDLRSRSWFGYLKATLKLRRLMRESSWR